ncbi:WecB/TagA/CpsF family glycosyltransferase [Rhodobacteraceae bacterium KMM 6894]|nr:WecB/TagA/CpsF family glycosyltransferase [Rhodobacteraceae bacterium KMM 6894]
MDLNISTHRIPITHPTRAALMATVGAHLAAHTGFRLATVNMDHLVKIEENPAFARAYGAQDIVVADGRPITWAARLAGAKIELLPGSEMVVPLCRLAAEVGRPVAMIGSTEQALNDAVAHLMRVVPGLSVAYRHAPPMGFDPNGAAAAEVLRDVDASGAGLCFLALGAPKQEILAARGADLAPSVGFASIGAGLDFLGGHQQRAPSWVRALALEWLWRTLSSPARMVPRYAKCFAILPGLLWRAWRAR